MSARTFSSVEEIERVLLDQNCSTRVCIERCPADDVTATFLTKANSLAAAGVPVRIVCADDVAAQRYCANLSSYSALCAHTVVTAQQFALEQASDKAVCAASGREARLLDANEIDVLMEDLKVSGLKPGRLREMFKFFCKSLSEYADEEQGWLITAEEQTVFALLTENLEVRRAMLPCELYSLVYRGLVDCGKELEPLTLLVDDYGTLSKAAQRLIEHVATTGLIVAGTVLPLSNAQEPYPFAEGFRAFGQRDDTVGLSVAASETNRTQSFAACLNPAAEFAFVADEVAYRIAQGVHPTEILVAVPNATWSERMGAALEERGVASLVDKGAKKVKGDPRTPGRFAQLKLLAFLRLYLNPNDFTALRSWLGFGDWLLRSDAFLELMAYARENEVMVPQAIEQLRTMNDEARPSKVFGKLDKPLDQLNELMVACAQPLSRAEVLELFERCDMPLSPEEAALLGDDPACANIARLACEATTQADALFANSASDCVTVSPYRRCHGRHARYTFVTGLVNGFLPALDAVDDKFTIDHRRSALERDRMLFDDVIATAQDEAICTLFERDVLENVGALHMQPSRVYIEQGVRYATLMRSEFL